MVDASREAGARAARPSSRSPARAARAPQPRPRLPRSPPPFPPPPFHDAIHLFPHVRGSLGTFVPVSSPAASLVLVLACLLDVELTFAFCFSIDPIRPSSVPSADKTYVRPTSELTVTLPQSVRVHADIVCLVCVGVCVCAARMVGRPGIREAEGNRHLLSVELASCGVSCSLGTSSVLAWTVEADCCCCGLLVVLFLALSQNQQKAMSGAFEGYIVHGTKRILRQAPYWAPPFIGGQ